MWFWPEQYSFLGPVLNPFFPFVKPQVTADSREFGPGTELQEKCCRLFPVLHSVCGWEEERQSGEYWKGRLQKTCSFTGGMEKVYWKEDAAEQGERRLEAFILFVQ